jgi:glycosyltransferase involved in cell wall biosynthesis
MTVNSDIRIAFVTPSWARGWRSQPVFREFAKLFPQTVVFTGYWPGFTRGYEGSFEVRQLRGVRPAGREGRTARGFTWASPRALWQLFRFRPQVIFTNGFHMCALYALLLKTILDTKVVLLWQGVSAETGGTPGSGRLWARRRMARFFDLAVSNTQDGVDYLQAAVGFPAAKLWHEICEVADRESLGTAEATPGANAEHPVFLFVGRTIREKGLSVLLEAGSILVKRGLKHFSIVLVGKGDDEPQLRRMAQDLGMESKVRWEGFVPYEDVGACYQACDVFVLPSLEDTWGVSVPEAMLFGKPILCSKYAGAREMVQPGVNGFVFDAREPKQLADCMARFIQQPELISRLGSASAEIVARYTPQRTAQVFASAVRTVRKAASTTPVTTPEKTCSIVPSR